MTTSNQNDEILAELLEARKSRTPCVLLTVVGFQGSTPRKPGAKMLVLRSGRIIGTVGGGAMEHALLGRAKQMMVHSQPLLLERVPMAEFGMQCGGTITVLFEPQLYPARLYLFGAGHIARPLTQMAATAGFDVFLLDQRPDLASAERFPGALRIIVGDPLEEIDELEFDAQDTYALVVTHSHALDEAIVRKLLECPIRFLGVIGSVRKKATFFENLKAAGYHEEQLEQIHMPVGLSIGAETPAEIAVSILAQLIAVRRSGNPTNPLEKPREAV